MLQRHRQLVQWALVPRLGLRTVDLLSSSVPKGLLSPPALASTTKPLRRPQVPHRTWAGVSPQDARPERRPGIRGMLVGMNQKRARCKV